MTGGGTIERLQAAVREDYHELGRHRRVYREMLRELPGNWHGDTREYMGGRGERRPMNLAGMAHWSTVQYLAGKQPRVIINTDVAEWKPWEEDIEQDISFHWDQEKFGKKQQTVVADALIQMGWAKVAADWERKVMPDGSTLFAPKVYIQPLQPTRVCYDPRCSDVDESPYTADLMLMPLAAAVNHPMFDRKKAAQLQATDRFTTEFDGDDSTARIIAEDENRSDEGFIDYVRIWHAYDRYNDRVRMWSASRNELVLRDDEWEGPDQGCYYPLRFRTLPHHPQPISVLGQGMDLHVAQNKLLTKSLRQAERQMDILRYTSADQKSVLSLQNMRDGMTALKEQGMMEQVSYGGANPKTVGMLPALKEWFSYVMGNMDTRAGLSVQAPTAFQERMLKSSGNVMIDDMQTCVYEWAKDIAWATGWYAMRDTAKSEMRNRRIGNSKWTFQNEWSGEIRSKLNWMKFNCDLSVYSFRNRSPQERLSDLAGAFQTFLMPGIQARQMLRATGDDFDLDNLMKTVAKYLDMPELNEMLHLFDKSPEQMGGQAPQEPGRQLQMPNTTRTNVRLDRGQNSGDKAMDLMGSIMGEAA